MTDYSFQPQQYGTPAPARDVTAVMGRRIVAWIIDGILFLAVAVGTFALFAEYVEVPTRLGAEACDILQAQNSDAANSCFVLNDRAYITSGGETAVQTLASFGYLAFFILIQGLAGGSPGKLLTGLRVVGPDGNRAGVGKSLVRTLLWVVDAAPWIIPLVGFIVGLTSSGHRRIGDMAAKTFVIRAADRGTPVLAVNAASPGGQTWGAPVPDWQSSPTRPTEPTPSSWAPTPGTTSPPAAVPTQPTISGVPDETPAPPPAASIGLPDGWADPPPEAATPLGAEPSFGSADPVARTPVDESPPDVSPDPEWWAGPESEPAAADPETSAPPEEPAPLTWEDPSPTAAEARTGDNGASGPPTTPNADFETSENTSPTAGPAPFVAPGTDPRVEAPRAAPEPAAVPPPQWDQARNTYIQWDPTRQSWLQWDAPSNRWKPIDT